MKDKRREDVADKTYQLSDYYRDEQLSKGMATSHEQVSDTYMEGTIDRAENKSRRDDTDDGETIPRKGQQ